MSNRDRLVRFYEQYAPDSVGNVDAILEKYKGKEEPMFAALVKKYGPEPTTQKANAGGTNNPYRDRLVRFYEKYAPDNAGNVDLILEKYKGKEEPMFAALVKKYGPEPSQNTAKPTPRQQQQKENNQDDFEGRLKRFYQKYAPENVPKVSVVLEKYEGREEAMFAALVKKYGPEPSHSEQQDDEGDEDREEADSREGEEEENEEVEDEDDREDTEENPYHDRLARFYRCYAAENVPKVDLILEKYTGKEEAMFAALVKKYGPEPKKTGPVDGKRGGPSLSPPPTAPRGERAKRSAYIDKRTEAEKGKDSADDEEQQSAEEDGDEDDVTQGSKHVAGATTTAIFDYLSVLGRFGFSEEQLVSITTFFSPSSASSQGGQKGPTPRIARFGAMVAVLMNLIPSEQLFQQTRGQVFVPLVVPEVALREIQQSSANEGEGRRAMKGGEEDDSPQNIFFAEEVVVKEMLEPFARLYYTAATAALTEIVDAENTIRQALYRNCRQRLEYLTHRALVLEHALLNIEPVETERRHIIIDEERLRRDGALLWFRNKRAQIVREAEIYESVSMDAQYRLKEEQFKALVAETSGAKAYWRREAKVGKWEPLSRHDMTPSPPRPYPTSSSYHSYHSHQSFDNSYQHSRHREIEVQQDSSPSAYSYPRRAHSRDREGSTSPRRQGDHHYYYGDAARGGGGEGSAGRGARRLVQRDGHVSVLLSPIAAAARASSSPVRLFEDRVGGVGPVRRSVVLTENERDREGRLDSVSAHMVHTPRNYRPSSAAATPPARRLGKTNTSSLTPAGSSGKACPIESEAAVERRKPAVPRLSALNSSSASASLPLSNAKATPSRGIAAGPNNTITGASVAAAVTPHQGVGAVATTKRSATTTAALRSEREARQASAAFAAAASKVVGPRGNFSKLLYRDL